jgi:hypothetical protein
MEIGAGMTTSRYSQPLLSNHRHRFHAIGICSSTRPSLRSEGIAVVLAWP